jgi:hypothetical protein
MRICTDLASAELTLFSRLGATSGATNRQRLFLFGCHGYIMQRCFAKSCSIVTRFGWEPGILPFFFAVIGEFGVASIAGSRKQSNVEKNAWLPLLGDYLISAGASSRHTPQTARAWGRDL